MKFHMNLRFYIFIFVLMGDGIVGHSTVLYPIMMQLQIMLGAVYGLKIKTFVEILRNIL